MRVAYIAHDGSQFESEDECADYEVKMIRVNKLKVFTTDLVPYNDDFGTAALDSDQIAAFIEANIDEINRLLA